MKGYPTHCDVCSNPISVRERGTKVIVGCRECNLWVDGTLYGSTYEKFEEIISKKKALIEKNKSYY